MLGVDRAFGVSIRINSRIIPGSGGSGIRMDSAVRTIRL